jgi:hypothetical protein
MSLKLVAIAMRELSYSEMENLALELRGVILERRDEPDMEFDIESYLHWMELLNGWAEGELGR